jgi:hypothetical protein
MSSIVTLLPSRVQAVMVLTQQCVGIDECSIIIPYAGDNLADHSHLDIKVPKRYTVIHISPSGSQKTTESCMPDEYITFSLVDVTTP